LFGIVESSVFEADSSERGMWIDDEATKERVVEEVL
jgi:hypothetical protein